LKQTYGEVANAETFSLFEHLFAPIVAMIRSAIARSHTMTLRAYHILVHFRLSGSVQRLFNKIDL
jgi:hypothetical protein